MTKQQLALDVRELCLLGAGLAKLSRDEAVLALAEKIETAWAEALHEDCQDCSGTQLTLPWTRT